MSTDNDTDQEALAAYAAALADTEFIDPKRSWTDAEREAARSASVERTQTAKVEGRLRQRPPEERRARVKLTDEQVIAGLRKWLNAGGDGRAKTWDSQRAPEGTVAAQTVAERFGSWAKALVLAGGTPVLSPQRYRSDRVDDDMVMLALVDFLVVTRDSDQTQTNYNRWRATYSGAGTAVSPGSILARFGTWKAAKLLARDIAKGYGELPKPSPVYVPAVLCSVEGCTRVLQARGLCYQHYKRWESHGDVRADVPIKRNRWSDDDLLRHLTCFITHVTVRTPGLCLCPTTDDVRRDAYIEFRKSAAAFSLAHPNIITQRFGSWPEAVRLAQELMQREAAEAEAAANQEPEPVISYAERRGLKRKTA